jgi:hypothetical protein
MLVRLADAMEVNREKFLLDVIAEMEREGLLPPCQRRPRWAHPMREPRVLRPGRPLE